MDLLPLIIAGVTLALAVLGICEVRREWRSTPDWSWSLTSALIFAAGNVIVAALAIVLAVHDAKTREATERQTITADEYDELIPVMRELQKGNDRGIHIVVVAPDFPRAAHQFADLLAYIFGDAGVGTPQCERIEEARHDGLVVYASEDTDRVRRLADALRGLDVEVKLAIGPPPDNRIAEKVDRLSESMDVPVVYVGNLE